MAVQAVPTKGNLMNTKKSLALAKNGLCFRVAVIIVLRSTTLVSTWSCLTP